MLSKTIFFESLFWTDVMRDGVSTESGSHCQDPFKFAVVKTEKTTFTSIFTISGV